MNSWDVWVYGCMGVWVYGCMDVWVYGCMDAVCMDSRYEDSGMTGV